MNEKENQFIYQTGHTSPPKSHSGLIAVLLVLVILLGGITSALGLMNIRLFHKLQNQQERTLSFETGVSLSREIPAALSLESFLPGVSYHELSPFYSRYYGVSQGLYVTEVEEDSICYRQGLRPGDILTALDGEPCKDEEAFQHLQEGCPVTVTLLRNGKLLTITCTP